MKTISISKAQAAREGDEVESVTIVINEPYVLPANLPAERSRDDYETEAKLLHDALVSALPGGIYDRLLLMLQKTASLFVVPYGGSNG